MVLVVRIYRGMHLVPVQLVPYLDAMVVRYDKEAPWVAVRSRLYKRQHMRNS